MIKKIVCNLFIKIFGEMTEQEKEEWLNILRIVAESAAKGAVEGAKK